MSPQRRLRDRISVVLHMAMTFVTTILLAQLWLFTASLEAMEDPDAPLGVGLAALAVSLAGCAAVWWLIRVFLRTESGS